MAVLASVGDLRFLGGGGGGVAGDSGMGSKLRDFVFLFVLNVFFVSAFLGLSGEDFVFLGVTTMLSSSSLSPSEPVSSGRSSSSLIILASLRSSSEASSSMKGDLK